MFDLTTVLACFFSASSSYVGWRNSNNPCDKPLTSDLTNSETGSFFNDFHPLLTYKNIKSIAINADSYPISEWETDVNYIEGKIIEYILDGKKCYFKSLDDVNLGNQPDISPLFWEEVDFLSDWYKQKSLESTDKLINAIAQQKKLRHKTKTILDDFKLYKNSGRINDSITKSGRFVGFSIQLDQSENIEMIIRQIGFQFTDVQTDMPIYLYHSSQSDPVSIINYSTTKAKSFEWLTTDYNLKYVDASYDTGSFFLGYYEEDVTGQAIRKDMNWNNPCYGCNGWKREEYRSFSQFVQMKPISISAQDIEAGRKLFNIDDVRYTNNTNFGLNLNLSIRCDWTDFICSNRDIFRNPLKTQVTYDFLNEMLYSTRDNDLREKIAAAIQGNDAIMGIEAKLKEEIDGLSFEMSDLGSPCTPCESRKGLRIKAA